MNNIVNLVKIIVDVGGDLRPMKYSECSRYQETGEKGFCFDPNTKESCIGVIVGKSVMKDITDEYSLLACNYWLNKDGELDEAS